MGCGASKYGSGNPEFTILVNESWNRAMGTLEIKKGQKNPNRDLVIRRSGWKTIRIFVSSTFKDFHSEREALVKRVFPDLRNWCESRRLQLIECDLRWVSVSLTAFVCISYLIQFWTALREIPCWNETCQYRKCSLVMCHLPNMFILILLMCSTRRIFEN